MWHDITNQNETEDFMEKMGNFHDGCLKELKYISGAYVCTDLSMQPLNDRRILKVILQRQYDDPSVIEMEFIGLTRFILIPVDPCINFAFISRAKMFFKNDCICWCDQEEFSEEGIGEKPETLICASKVRWRSADEFIGDGEVYLTKSL
jgi:hypothetical protein